MEKNKTNSKNYRLFFLSILLWAQIVIGLFLFSWRYKLIIFDNWGIYITPVSETLPSFLQFVNDHCPENARVVYLANNTTLEPGQRRAIVRYELYPRFVHLLDWAEANLPLDNQEETYIQIHDRIRSFQPDCLIVEGIVGDLSIPGEKFMFDQENYLVVLSGEN
ncbi:MAG: hypothetical protein R6X34_01010 [Chloroflexota bacterium]